MDPQRPLKLCFIPYFGAASHTFSLSHIARSFSFHGQYVTIVTTPRNAAIRIQKILNDEAAASSDGRIILHTIPLEFRQAGLPEDFDELNQPEDLHAAVKLYRAIYLLRQPIQEFLESDKPDCIISDPLFPWYADLAANLQIPCISFNPCSVFSSCVKEALRNPDSPHHCIESNEKPFVVPGLPVSITLTKAELPACEFSVLMERIRETELKSYGLLVNSFGELESDNIEYLEKVMGLKVLAVGPASEIDRNISRRGQQGNDDRSNYDAEQECFSWLNSRKPNSVLYINFGTVSKFPDEQLMEIACALVSSDQEFIWVVRRKNEENKDDDEKWLPKGFHEKIAGRGMVVKGWAPQVSILNNPAIGSFMTHCGWNSILEGLGAGVPMIAWPLTADQFYNEKFITQVAGVAVVVGGHEWAHWFDSGKKIITRENIEKAIHKLMDGTDKAEEMRKKAKEYAEMAKKAVEEGGSSSRTVNALIEELKQLRNAKSQLKQ